MKKTTKGGAALALSLGIIMLLAVIIGSSARLFFDKVYERLSAPPSREEIIDFTMKGAPSQNHALYGVGGIPISDSAVID